MDLAAPAGWMRAIFEPSMLTTTLRCTPPLPSMSVPVLIVRDCAAHKLAQANKHNFIKPRNSGCRQVGAPGERLYDSCATHPADYAVLASQCNAALSMSAAASARMQADLSGPISVDGVS